MSQGGVYCEVKCTGFDRFFSADDDSSHYIMDIGWLSSFDSSIANFLFFFEL